MADIDRQIRDRINSFVYELTELLRRSALDTISDALRGNAAATAGKLGGQRAGRGKATAVARRGHGGKRSADEIEAMAGNVVQYVKANPGKGVEQISQALGVPSRDLTLPIRKLVGTGKLSTQGHKRATKYFPPGEPASPRAGRGRKKKAAKRGGRRGR